MAAFPTGVTVVTAIGAEGQSGATANAIISLSLRPPMMLASLDRASRTLTTVRAAESFAINVLAAGQEDLARRFASKEAEPQKWDGVGWTERDGAPRLDGVLVWLRCELRELIEAGDHFIVTAEVLDVDTEPGEPLVFHHGVYRDLREG